MSVDKVLSHIDEAEVVRLAQELVKIPSENPPGGEKRVAEFLGNYMRDMGLEVQVKDVEPGRPNVIGVLRGAAEGPVILLNGHLDVVPAGDGWTVDPYGGTIADGRLYGRGSADMKGPIAAMVAAVKTIQRADVSLRGTVVIAGVVSEEDSQAGTKQLAKDRVKADFAIVGEPTGLKPVIAHKGNIYFDITTRGIAAHGSIPDHGLNAIEKMFSVGKGLEGLSQRLREKSHYLVGHPTLSIGTIKGGTITNAVPDQCVMSVDRRLIPGETAAEAEAEIWELLNTLAAADPEFRAELEVPVAALPMETSESGSVVRAVRSATMRVLGADPGVHGWSATCDANILMNEMGIPTVIFGPGDIATAHRPDEYIEIDQLTQATMIYSLAILDLLG